MSHQTHGGCENVPDETLMLMSTTNLMGDMCARVLRLSQDRASLLTSDLEHIILVFKQRSQGVVHDLWI